MQNLQRNNDKLKKKLEEYESVLEHTRDEQRKLPAYGATYVDPSTHLHRLPSLAPAKGATRHFTRTFTVAAQAAGDVFGVKLTPGIKDFISIANRPNVQAIAGIYNVQIAGLGYSYDYTTGRVLTQYEVSQGRNEFEWTSTLSGAAMTQFTIYNNSPVTQSYTISYLIDGTWSVRGTLAIKNQAFSPPNVATTFPVPVVILGFGGVRIDPVVQHNYTFRIVDSLATYALSNSLNRNLINDEWIEAGQVERYRISAMSVLASYRGNLLENAGVIAGARAPTMWRGTESNLYTSICKLADNKYKGPIVEGVYAWWLPMDNEELDFHNGSSPYTPESTSLYFGGVFGDAGGSLEVTIDVIVDFYSPLQIFERKLFPPMSDGYFMLLHDLSQLPAVTCNPKHLDILKKGAKAAASGIMKGYDLALKHPEMVNIFLKALAAVAM